MNLKKRKIIAREILYFTSCLILTLLVFLGTLLLNQIIKSKIISAQNRVTLLNSQISSLSNSYADKLHNQKWFYNECKMRNMIVNSENSIEHWSRLENIQRADSIVYRWNNVWSFDLKQGFINFGFKNGEDLNEFIYTNSLDNIETEILKSVNSSEAQIKALKARIEGWENYLKYDFDSYYYTIDSVYIILILLFPLRYLFYGISWSIRTLKAKE